MAVHSHSNLTKILNIREYMRIQNKTYIFFIFTGLVFLVQWAFLHHLGKIGFETFPPSNISSALFDNRDVMAAYTDCIHVENIITNNELQQCKLRASRSWFTQAVEEAHCNISQARAVELACEPIIKQFRKKV